MLPCSFMRRQLCQSCICSWNAAKLMRAHHFAPLNWIGYPRGDLSLGMENPGFRAVVDAHADVYSGAVRAFIDNA